VAEQIGGMRGKLPVDCGLDGTTFGAFFGGHRIVSSLKIGAQLGLFYIQGIYWLVNDRIVVSAGSLSFCYIWDSYLVWSTIKTFTKQEITIEIHFIHSSFLVLLLL
jgi:hypothetical protein